MASQTDCGTISKEIFHDACSTGLVVVQYLIFYVHLVWGRKIRHPDPADSPPACILLLLHTALFMDMQVLLLHVRAVPGPHNGCGILQSHGSHWQVQQSARYCASEMCPRRQFDAAAPPCVDLSTLGH